MNEEEKRKLKSEAPTPPQRSRSRRHSMPSNKAQRKRELGKAKVKRPSQPDKQYNSLRNKYFQRLRVSQGIGFPRHGSLPSGPIRGPMGYLNGTPPINIPGTMTDDDSKVQPSSKAHVTHSLPVGTVPDHSAAVGRDWSKFLQRDVDEDEEDENEKDFAPLAGYRAHGKQPHSHMPVSPEDADDSPLPPEVTCLTGCWHAYFLHR